MAETKPVEHLERVVIRFAGDSGDGMQLTGDRFTSASAMFGNDLATLPDFPAEIRAPAGTLAGVSAFQVHISDHEITTPGDAPNVLVAMNPAALRNELPRLEPGGTVIVNVDAFEDRNLTKAGYTDNPLTDGSLDGFTVFEVPMTTLTQRAVEPVGVKPRDAERSKNFFALGLVFWMYTRPIEPVQVGLERRRIHRHQHVRLVAGRGDVVVGDVDLEGRHAGQRPGRGPDLRGEVGQRGQVVAEHGAGAREAVAGELHAITGVAGEADDDAVEALWCRRSAGALGGVGQRCPPPG